MLEVHDLTCTRGDRALFTGLSFSLPPGGLLHVTGRNGCGKTTLLRTLCGLTRPAHGHLHWRGQDVRALGDDYRGELVYVGHTNGVQGELRPAENLRMAACLGEQPTDSQAEQALTRLGLAALRAFPAKVLSAGQKRRLALARLLLTSKPLWILDEPFSALDSESTQSMSTLVTQHVQAGGMVVITSHVDLALPQMTTLRLDAPGGMSASLTQPQSAAP